MIVIVPNSKKLYLIIGAGFAGCTVAERLAKAGKSVLVMEKRDHIGGNAYDEFDQYGVLVHRYGPHIFHTKAKRIVDYLSQFTEWRNYQHKVLANVAQNLYPIPINRDTINQLYGLDLDETGVQQFLEKVRIPYKSPQNSEEVVLNSVGRDLFEKFFHGYTKKQWGLEPCQLSAGVTARIPVRFNQDDRYFTDSYQMMPAEGYTRLFKAMLDHPNIDIQLERDFFQDRQKFHDAYWVYTGPIDRYFDYCYGELPYRSLRFEHEYLAGQDQFQAVGTINYPNDFDFTRITEFKHLTGQQHPGTSIVREFPQASGEPFYPVPRAENENLFQRYKKLAAKETHVSFVGRLAQYRYYNMDQVVAAALKTAEEILQIGNKT